MRKVFLKIPKPKRFDFKARYYDAEKEELQHRVAIIKAEIEKESKSEMSSEARRQKISSEWKMNRTRQDQFSQSNFRVLLIAGILALIGYYFFYL